MKKISYLLIMLMIFNLICMFFLNCNVYADPTNEYSGMNVESSMTINDYKSMSEDGKTTISTNSGDVERSISLSDSDVGAVGSKLAGVISSLSGVAVNLMSNLSLEGGLYYVNSKYSAYENHLFTINSLIFGEYLLFNSKPYQKTTDLISEGVKEEFKVDQGDGNPDILNILNETKEKRIRIRKNNN